MNVNLAVSSFEHNDEEKWFTMAIKCAEFPSVNSAHGYRLRGETNARVFDLPHVVQFRSEVRDQFIFTDPKKHCPWINDYEVYYLYIKFIFKQYFWSRDYDNHIKIFQDEIAAAVHINDARIVEGHQFKCYRPGDYEYAFIKFGVSNFNYNEFR